MKLKEMCQRSEKDHELSMKERVELVRRLADFRRIHKRDQRRIEDVLSEVLLVNSESTTCSQFVLVNTCTYWRQLHSKTINY